MTHGLGGEKFKITEICTFGNQIEGLDLTKVPKGPYMVCAHQFNGYGVGGDDYISCCRVMPLTVNRFPLDEDFQ